jgi:glutathione S-transferase
VTAPRFVVHHLERSRSTRILWALEELGLPYELKTYKRHPKTMRAGPEIKAVHPVGRFPVLTVDGEALAESGAVLDTLAVDFAEGQLRPAAGPALRQYRYWLHFAEGSLMAPLLVMLIMGQLSGPQVPFVARPVMRAIAGQVNKNYTFPQLADLLGHVEGTLAGAEYFAGDTFTMADIQMSYGVLASLDRVPGAEKYTAMKRWAERVTARPAYQKAIEVGGPVLL